MKTRLILPFVTSLVLPTAALAAAPHIVAAENFYGGVAQQISGTPVLSILKNPNQDPHEFTTDAATARSIADADIVIYNGAGYDTWIEKLIANQGKANRVVLKVADLLSVKDGDNPHIWYDPKTMPALGDKLVEVLSQADPAHAGDYRKRLDAFKAEMKPELEQIAAIKGTFAGVEVTATEPVFGYMAEALNLKMLNYDFQVKIMNDAEPGARQTADFEKSLRSKSAKVLFYNSQVTDPTTERMQKIAQNSGVPIVGVTETQPPNQKSYVAWMQQELTSVQAALTAKNP